MACYALLLLLPNAARTGGDAVSVARADNKASPCRGPTERRRSRAWQNQGTLSLGVRLEFCWTCVQTGASAARQSERNQACTWRT